MNIPTMFRPSIATFEAGNQIAGPTTRQELEREDAEKSLQSMKDSFAHWQSLDETEADLAKGVPGEVRVAGYAPEEGTSAVFSGDTNSGQLTVFQDEPAMHYGATRVTVTRFEPNAAEMLHAVDNNGYLMGPFLTHVDRQLASDGPISLGGGSVTVTLHDHAQSGYILRPQD